MLKRNTLESVIQFIFKYIWIFCALLMVLEIGSTTYTATILMQQSAKGVLDSVQGEISGRVGGVLRLLKGIAANRYYSNLSIPMFERVTTADSYRESYDLYMVAFCDENVNVISSDETEPPEEPFSLAHRDYMQRLYATGEYQITDAFLAGADGETMNYTIAVPILKEGEVKGCVFGSIYFDDIKAIMERSLSDPGRHFYLLGREDTFMAGDSDYTLGENFDELTKDAYFFGSSLEEINANLADGKSGSCWQWNGNGLRYVMYSPVAPTEWTLAYQVGFGTIFQSLLPVLLIKCLFYFLLCLAIAVFGRRYLRRHLSAVNHLLDRVTTMQRELFQPEGTEEAPDYENLLELTQTGLTDQLTGLATRGVLFQRAAQLVGGRSQQGTLCFLDLDDLKRINDNFGHEAGDCALLHFAKILKQYEEKYGGVAARYGGDEFILILPDMDEMTAVKTADLLCAELNTTLSIKGMAFPIHGSVGLAHYPRHGETPEELISKADLALYSAKQRGKNCCCSFDE